MTVPLSECRIARFAAVIVLALGAGLSGSVPGFAQSEPQASFRLPLGGETGDAQAKDGGRGRLGAGEDGQNPGKDRSEEDATCLEDEDIRQGLATEGFADVDVRRPLEGSAVEAYASYGRWIYKMRVDRCSGEVDNVERVRRVGGGLGLHFDYGAGY